jgi:hypothetical protein
MTSLVLAIGAISTPVTQSVAAPAVEAVSFGRSEIHQ